MPAGQPAGLPEYRSLFAEQVAVRERGMPRAAGRISACLDAIARIGADEPWCLAD
jgi:hypothetical protein